MKQIIFVKQIGHMSEGYICLRAMSVCPLSRNLNVRLVEVPCVNVSDDIYYWYGEKEFKTNEESFSAKHLFPV